LNSNHSLAPRDYKPAKNILVRLYFSFILFLVQKKCLEKCKKEQRGQKVGNLVIHTWYYQKRECPFSKQGTEAKRILHIFLYNKSILKFFSTTP